MNLSQLKSDLEKIKSRFKEEIGHLRPGRATPEIVNKIMVDCYGSKMSLQETAAINAEDARTIRIQPWDKNLIVNIEHAIRNSEIGLQPIVDKETLRLTLPELTEERRKQLVKILKEKFEEARVEAKLKREDVWKKLCDKERKGEISEDDKFKQKEELQKIIDKTNEELEEIFAKKEKEIQS